MRTVRIFFKKTGRMKFISHLDMTRFMARLIRKANIPVWYTEGFNQHIYLNFALPLSLGFEGLYEILELRIIDEGFTNEDCLKAVQSVNLPDVEFFGASDPVNQMSDIAFAEFTLDFGEKLTEFKDKLESFLQQDSIICLKKGKKGKMKEIDLIPKIGSFSFKNNTLLLKLTAGNEDNLNPSLVMDTFFKETNTPPVFYSVTRTAVLDKNGKNFK